MNARITIIGIEKILNDLFNESITDSWSLDSESFDKETLMATIIQKGGQFEPVYTDPTYFYNMCNFWWKKWLRTFNKWFIVFDKEYEPLWDRNGYEEVHEDTVDVLDNDTSYQKSGVTTEVMDDDTTFSETGKTTEVMDDDTTGTSNTTTENTVSAYDSNTYQPHDKSVVNSNTTGTDDRTTVTDVTRNGTGTDDRTTTTNMNESGTGTNDSNNDRDFDRSYHSWGNWGISQTSQKLLESELKVQYINTYNHIADIFLDEMTVKVY